MKLKQGCVCVLHDRELSTSPATPAATEAGRG